MMQNSAEWLSFAKTDLEAAKSLLKLNAKFCGIVAYHAQQAAEKSLHAYLVLHERHAPKTHDLSYLVKLCSSLDSDFVVLTDRAKALDPFVVQTRYPDHYLYTLSVTGAQELVEFAQKIVEFVEQRMG